MTPLFDRRVKGDVELCLFLVSAGLIFARGIVDLHLEDSCDARLPVVHAHVRSKNFSFLCRDHERIGMRTAISKEIAQKVENWSEPDWRC